MTHGSRCKRDVRFSNLIRVSVFFPLLFRFSFHFGYFTCFDFSWHVSFRGKRKTPTDHPATIFIFALEHARDEHACTNKKYTSIQTYRQARTYIHTHIHTRIIHTRVTYKAGKYTILTQEYARWRTPRTTTHERKRNVKIV